MSRGTTKRALVVCALVLASCSTEIPRAATPPPSGSPIATSPAPPVSQSPLSSSAPTAFQPGDCTYPATDGTPTLPTQDTFRMVISLPQGWTQKDTLGTETVLKLEAPSAYANGPTTIDVVSLFPDIPHHSPSEYLAGVTQVSYILGPIQACTVNGDPAAYAPYTLPARPGFPGSRTGYIVIWTHVSVVYELRLQASGVVDLRAIRDTKGVLNSLFWATDTRPPQYTPSGSP